MPQIINKASVRIKLVLKKTKQTHINYSIENKHNFSHKIKYVLLLNQKQLNKL